MRIRSIKPEFWRSDDIARLRRDVQLLFIGLWSYVDDNGVGIDDYRQITADLFALEDDPIAARQFVRESLATLSAASLVARYTHNGKSYLFITGWDRHQRVDKPGKPRYPRPDDPGTSMTSENTHDSDPSATLSRHSRDTLAPGTGEQGNRGTGEQGTTDSSSPSARTDVRDGRSEAASDPEEGTTAAHPGKPSAPTRHTAHTGCRGDSTEVGDTDSASPSASTGDGGSAGTTGPESQTQAASAQPGRQAAAPQSGKALAPTRPEIEQLCDHLADRIEANGCKRPNIGKRWRDAARLLLDADGRTVDQVMRAIDWCQADEFWRANILSMPKLRQRYDQLRLAAGRNDSRASPNSRNTGQNRHIDDLTAEQRAARNPFIGAVRSSQVRSQR